MPKVKKTVKKVKKDKADLFRDDIEKLFKKYGVEQRVFLAKVGEYVVGNVNGSPVVLAHIIAHTRSDSPKLEVVLKMSEIMQPFHNEEDNC